MVLFFSFSILGRKNKVLLIINQNKNKTWLIIINPPSLSIPEDHAVGNQSTQIKQQMEQVQTWYH
jgi:hypothetical protein